jgi:hypothetical protein
MERVLALAGRVESPAAAGQIIPDHPPAHGRDRLQERHRFRDDPREEEGDGILVFGLQRGGGRRLSGQLHKGLGREILPAPKKAIQE